MPHIMSVSYDAGLLRSRQWMLERRGYTVTSLATFQSAVDECRSGTYDLVIVGHSIPLDERARLVSEILAHCSSRILALRKPGEYRVKGAVESVDAFNPQLLLDTVDRLLFPRCNAG